MGEDKRECIKATLLEQDRLLHDIEEGSLLDLGTTTPKQVDVLECRTTDVPVSIVKSKERNSPPEESIEDLTSALIEEIVTSHRLEVHLDRVSYKLRAAHSAIVRQAKNLLNEVTTTLTYAKQMDCPPTEKIEEYFNRAEEINHAVFQLTAVAVRKASDLRTVSSDSSSGLDVTRSSAIVDARLAKQPWTTCIGGGGGAALTLLSDIYLSIKAMEQGGQDAEEVWVAPQAFERATQKYWVKEENLTEVLLSCVAKVPLLVYGMYLHSNDSTNGMAFERRKRLIMM